MHLPHIAHSPSLAAKQWKTLRDVRLGRINSNLSIILNFPTVLLSFTFSQRIVGVIS